MALIVHEYYPNNAYEPACELVCFECDYCKTKRKETYEYVIYTDNKAGEVSFCHDDCLYDWLENDKKSNPFGDLDDFDENC